MKRTAVFWIIFLTIAIIICAIGIVYPPIFNFGTGVGVYYLVNEFYPIRLNKSNGSSWESGD